MSFLIISAVVFFTVIVELVDGLRCYECGVFVQTSVTPCQNLTREHLKECDHDYCSKYVGLSAVVYGCEPRCTERSKYTIPQCFFPTQLKITNACMGKIYKFLSLT